MASYRALHRFCRSQRGATAAEFALVVPALVLLTIGTINAAVMIYTAASLHFAVENTARWTAIQITTGASHDATAVQAHGESVYKGATPSVTFTGTSPTCGSQVSGTANYNFSTGLTTTLVPIAATACYPLG